MTYRTAADHAKQIGPTERFLRGLVRRMLVTLSDGARWQLLGYESTTAGKQTVEVAPYTGIGFYSRPPRGAKAEAVTVAIGGDKNRAIVGLRDETTRAKVVGDLAENETAIYNDQALVVVKADGTVEIRLAGGIAVPLATLADVQAIRTAIAGAATAANDGGATFKAAILEAWGGPTGTTVLKAQ